ncbi:hypothetical protein Bca4012_018658 [Brassica carinata]|uniref:Uncharacterized protein n=1 Tax=Brassica carinata TaxID=52824 RepID=A0A8X8BFD2_BRACI|nr:hypothetical protein Bca52824_002962 [Brassica carinata]
MSVPVSAVTPLSLSLLFPFCSSSVTFTLSALLVALRLGFHRSRVRTVIKGHFSLLENPLHVEAGKKVLTFLDLRALEVWLLRCVCSLCSRRASEHLVVLREALLWSGVEVVVYGGFKVTLQVSSQSSSLFPSGLVPSTKSVSTCSWRQPTRVFRVSIFQWGLWSLGGLVGDSGIFQRREQDVFMVVSSHIVFAGLGMLLASTSSGRWSGGIGVLEGMKQFSKGLVSKFYLLYASQLKCW